MKGQQKPQKNKPEDEVEDDEEEEEEEEGEEQDNDFDFEDQKGGKGGPPQGTKKVDNLPFDEAVELSDQGEEEEEEEDQPQQKPKAAPPGGKLPAQAPSRPQKKPADEESDEDGKDKDDHSAKELPGGYNPSDYDSLNVGQEVKDLFKYIQRYKPLNIELDTKLKVFVPDFIPAVGEVDAFLKITRPDNTPETLGLTVLDEPTLNQSKKSKLDLQFKEFLKKVKSESTKVVHSIENAEKNPKEILSWIQDVAEIQKKKQPPSVSYTKGMPDIDSLMQVWPAEFEDALQNVKIPSEEIDLDLENYCRMACALLDIPVHNTTNQRNVIESLHVFFTLYSEFKANQHFRQMNQDGMNPGHGEDVQTMKF